MPGRAEIQLHPYYERASKFCAGPEKKMDVRDTCKFMEEWDAICRKLRRAAGLRT